MGAHLVLGESKDLWSIDLPATARRWLIKAGNGGGQVIPTLKTTLVTLPVGGREEGGEGGREGGREGMRRGKRLKK